MVARGWPFVSEFSLTPLPRRTTEWGLVIDHRTTGGFSPKPAGGAATWAPARAMSTIFLPCRWAATSSPAFIPAPCFPGETDLLERFGVSRPTLREAFRVLAAKGLIVSRRKVGTRVRDKADWNMLDPDILAWHLHAAPTEDFVADLFQLREMVEPSAAALAAGWRDPATLDRINAAYGDMERWSNGNGDLIGADLRFHQAILEATSNHFIGALGGLIKTALIGSFSSVGKAQPSCRTAASCSIAPSWKPSAANEEEAHARMALLLRESMEDVRSALRNAAWRLRIRRTKGRPRRGRPELPAV